MIAETLYRAPLLPDHYRLVSGAARQDSVSELGESPDIAGVPLPTPLRSPIHDVCPQNVLDSARHGLAVVPKSVLKNDTCAGSGWYRADNLVVPPVVVKASMPSLKFAVVVEIEHKSEETFRSVGIAECTVPVTYKLLSILIAAASESRIETDQVPALAVDGKSLRELVTKPLEESVCKLRVVDHDAVVVPVRGRIVAVHRKVAS